MSSFNKNIIYIKALIVALSIDLLGRFFMVYAFSIFALEFGFLEGKGTVSIFKSIFIIPAIMGTIISMYSGYICQKVSNSSGYHLIFLLVLLSFIFELFFRIGYTAKTIGTEIVTGLFNIPVYLFGAWIYLRWGKQKLS
jgi:hypothetical protein